MVEAPDHAGPLIAVLLVSTAVLTPVAFAAPGETLPTVGAGVAVPGDLLQDGPQDRAALRSAAPIASSVVVELGYDRRPTTRDLARIQATPGVRDTYRYRSWDAVLVRGGPGIVPDVRDLPGVVSVDRLGTATPDLPVATRSTRVRAADVSADGLDHRNAVHETLGLRGEGMVVAVIDGGIDNHHEALDDLDDDPTTRDPKLVTKPDPAGPEAVVPAGAVVGPGLAPVGCVDPPDRSGHGTHVAGIAVGTRGESGNGHAGVAPKARLVDISFVNSPFLGIEGASAAFDWILAFNRGETCFGDPGEDAIDVVVMSQSLSEHAPDSPLNRKITDVVREGIVFVVSAGNEGPAPLSLTKGAEGAIFSAAADERDTVRRSDDLLSDYSSRGPRLPDLDDDGLDELRPDVAAPGTAVRAPDAHSRSGYITLSGTSMAAPHVGGIAALMLQADPGLRPVDLGSHDAMGDPGAVPVRDLLIQTAQYKNATERTPPQVEQPGRFGLRWNNAWGYGLVDAYTAVEGALATS